MSKTITLAAALKFNGGDYQNIELREFTAGEWKRSQTHGAIGCDPQMIALLTAVSGWPQPVIEMVPYSKYDEACRYLLGFISAGRETGENYEPA